MSTILLIILVLALLGALPTWPHSRAWGYARPVFSAWYLLSSC